MSFAVVQDVPDVDDCSLKMRLDTPEIPSTAGGSGSVRTRVRMSKAQFKFPFVTPPIRKPLIGASGLEPNQPRKAVPRRVR